MKWYIVPDVFGSAIRYEEIDTDVDYSEYDFMAFKRPLDDSGTAFRVWYVKKEFCFEKWEDALDKIESMRWEMIRDLEDQMVAVKYKRIDKPE